MARSPRSAAGKVPGADDRGDRPIEDAEGGSPHPPAPLPACGVTGPDGRVTADVMPGRLARRTWPPAVPEAIPGGPGVPDVATLT